jgi:hypothetical protein
MIRRRIHPQQGAVAKDLGALLPEVRLFADNYNNLCEAPTVFYAAALVAIVTGQADFTHVVCARAYLFFRVLHSIVHVTVNRVILRFALFMLSWLPLAVMIIREAAWLYF